MSKGSVNARPAVLSLLVAALLVAAVSLVFRAGRPPGDDSPEAGFTRDMMVHHAQAVEMADIVRDKTRSEEIRTLATDITLTQQAQIGQMRGWLDVWGLPITGTKPAMSWMGDPTTRAMPGMASSKEINTLRRASPEKADEQFLKLMIPHHQAAIPMAEAVLKRTDRPEVEQFARAISSSQKAEVRTMKEMLRARGVSPPKDAPAMQMNGNG